MRLVDGNHVVQQFATTVADPTLGDPVLPRTGIRVGSLSIDFPTFLYAMRS